MRFNLPSDKEKTIWLLLAAAIGALSGQPAVGLVAGLGFAVFVNNGQKEFTSKLSKFLLQTAVIMLGFKLNISTLIKVGKGSVIITAATICIVMTAGYFLGRLLKLDKKLSTLISSGTAICGGSAIAAIAPAISANSSQIAVSMGIVFLLNAIALFIFPPIGHFFHMTQEQFGLWAAIAIHDTSSVVGATVSYGSQAAAIGTTVKLTRALWILPLALGLAKIHKSQSKAKFPLFLIGFVGASVARSLFPSLNDAWNWFGVCGKHLMTSTLFFIGLALNPKDIKTIGSRPLISAVMLWITIALSSFAIIFYSNAVTFI